MERVTYFQHIKSIRSPLLHLAGQLDPLYKATADGSIDELFAFADLMEELNTVSAKARASFIRLQIKGVDAEDLFEEFRESWGIPKFEEDLVTVQDFRNGFLWTFRDHTTSWSEDDEAREWFYTHVEARFARRYEYWARDHGPELMLLLESGAYKNILKSIITKHGDYSPLISPVFSNQELKHFYSEHKEDDIGFDKASLLKIMEQNENWG
jgi:hypothetical protein